MKTAEGKYLKDDASNYDEKAYQNPAVTVDIVVSTIIEDKLKVLLIKRKYPPYKDHWAVPGGFVNIEKKETLEQTAQRELGEETGLKNIYLEQLYTYGDPDRDPRTRVITVAYFALVPYQKVKKQNIEASDDAKEAKWWSTSELPKLAFDHNRILDDFKKRIEGKAWYSPIAFEFLSRKLTLPEIQKVFEIITNRKETIYNFRRKLFTLFNLKELGEYKEGIRRPAKLYMLK